MGQQFSFSLSNEASERVDEVRAGSESELTTDMGSSSSKPSVDEKDKPIIMMLGGPGTGKGTQCSRMVKEFGFKHISLGDILREEVKQGTQVGKKCSKIMKEGKLVPVNLTLELMKKAMKQSNNASGYILDGFPRATSQARAFQKQVKEPSLVLYLHAPQQVLLHRLMQRGETSGRADDNVDTIKKRFNTFKKESLPVVSFYEKNTKSIVKKVCRVTTPDDVYNQVRQAVKNVLTSPATTHLRRHVRRRVAAPNKAAEESHVKRVRRRKGKKLSMDECPGHPKGSPVAPSQPQECIIM